ncbi:MAG: DUF1080 domain-containing protein [Planctomycetes bacterium]|nr:DUF1080 domain-containing protein [Planctomycetota bacterium]
MMLRSLIRRFRPCVLIPLSFLSVYGQEQSANTAPGVLVRIYDIGQPMHALPELAPHQLPNTVKILPSVDLETERGDFGEFKDRFLTEVTGFLRIEEPGTYGFRLMSDDGAKLWIDGRLVIDHDGLHGPTPKDGEIELDPGLHALRVFHFESSGGEELLLGWRPATNTGDYTPIPAAVLSHDADAPRATSPGTKRIIRALRRGRPGDGTPVAGVHPSFRLSSAGTEPRAERSFKGLAYESLKVVTDVTDATVGPIVWLPADRPKIEGVSVLPLRGGIFDGQVLVAARGGTGIQRMFVESAGETFQGCIFRFTQGLAGSVDRLTVAGDGVYAHSPEYEAIDDLKIGDQLLRPLWQSPLEMVAVRALTNGLEIEFNKVLHRDVGWDPDSFYIEQWPFQLRSAPRNQEATSGVDAEARATAHAPRRDGIRYPVKSAGVSGNRTRVFLEIDGLKTSHVIYLRLLPPCVAPRGGLPWSTEAWYTLNAIPNDRYGTVRVRPAQPPQNVLSETERAAGWRLLFDGKTTQGWRGFKKDTIPDGWEVYKGCLVRVGGGGDIITEEQFDNFELKLEWRISVGGNSGIFFRVSEQYRYPWETGPEVQVLDNYEHADGRNPLTTAGSNYALHAPLRSSIRPVGLFNAMRLRVDGNRVEHWLNGLKIIEYELHSPRWKELVAKSKFSKMPHYGMMSKGHIDLQDHGDKVWYRNIKIRPLKRE